MSGLVVGNAGMCRRRLLAGLLVFLCAWRQTVAAANDTTFCRASVNASCVERLRAQLWPGAVLDVDTFSSAILKCVETKRGEAPQRTPSTPSPPEPPTPPTPPSPTPAPAPTPAPPAASSSSGVDYKMILIGAMTAAGLLLVSLLITYRDKLTGWGRPQPGAPSGRTCTLLVTDIENSTLLWESLDQEAMNESVELHHALVRTLLVKYGGYESATEGDSFIAAFHSTESAVLFSSSFQQQLLHQPWPVELMESSLAACVWAKSTSSSTSLSEGLADCYATAVGLPTQRLLRRGPSRNLTTNPETVTESRHISTASDIIIGLPKLEAKASDSAPAVLDLVGGEITTALDAPTTTLDMSGGTLDSSLEDTSSLVPMGGAVADATADMMDSGNILTMGRFCSGLVEGCWEDLPETVFEAVLGMWVTCTAPPLDPVGKLRAPSSSRRAGQRGPMLQDNVNVRLVFRGLRVRLGMHTGVHNSEDCLVNSTTGRASYGGLPLALAKAAADCGHGGMVLLTQQTFEKLPPFLLQNKLVVISMGSCQFLKHSLPTTTVTPLYQLVVEGLEQRMALSPSQQRLRDVSVSQTGAMDAPLGLVAVAFVNFVGASTLMAWDRDLAQAAIQKFHAFAVEGLMMHHAEDPRSSSRSGYLVEMAHGLVLAAFSSPSAALLWGVQLVERLKTADWPAEILAHELCEQVVVATRRDTEESGTSGGFRRRRVSNPSHHRGVAFECLASQERNTPGGRGPAGPSTRRPYPTSVQVLLRGPRLKVGVDIGLVHAHVNPATGRIAYRGRVMNRASRIAEKAGSGQVWCSGSAWAAAVEMAGPQLAEQSVEGHELGAFALKGLNERIDLVHCSMDAPDVSLRPASNSVTWADVYDNPAADDGGRGSGLSAAFSSMRERTTDNNPRSGSANSVADKCASPDRERTGINPDDRNSNIADRQQPPGSGVGAAGDAPMPPQPLLPPLPIARASAGVARRRSLVMLAADRGLETADLETAAYKPAAIRSRVVLASESWGLEGVLAPHHHQYQSQPAVVAPKRISTEQHHRPASTEQQFRRPTSTDQRFQRPISTEQHAQRLTTTTDQAFTGI